VKTRGEDAAQELFLSAFVHLKVFEEVSPIANWLTRMPINVRLLKLVQNREVRRSAPWRAKPVV